jgi:hypothetical protein
LELRIRVRGKNAIVKGKPSEIASFIEKIEQQSQLEQIQLERLPGKEAIVQFLEGRSDFTHSLCDVMQKFLGRELNTRTERKLYDNLYRRVESARRFIESKYQGMFTKKHTVQFTADNKAKPVTIYTFIKIPPPQSKAPNMDKLVQHFANLK